jgi:peptide/nickel transport system permease protein
MGQGNLNLEDRMQEYILRRILQAIPILVGISIVSFSIVIFAPGDPLTTMYPPYMLQKMDQEMIRHEMGLDKPLPIQYLNMINKLITGKLYSFSERRLVIESVVERLPTTLSLGALSLLISVILSIPIATISATKQQSWIDGFIDVGSLVGISLPSFWVSLVAILIFSEKLKLLPSAGLRPIGSESYNLLEMLPYLVMPVSMLTLMCLPGLMRYARAGMIEVMREDYIRTARGKGLTQRIITYRHALKNAMLPVVTEIGLLIPWLFGGTAIIETIFSLPGLGRLGVKAALGRDYPVILTINLLVACLTILSGILTDIAYSILDPRIRQG